MPRNGRLSRLFSRRVLLLYIALALLHIAPVWSVHYFPTGDGPSHVYNSWVLHGLITGDAPPAVEQMYRVVWRPVPNWTSHAAMALLMAFVSPLLAEKIVVTAIIVLVLAGAWVLTTTVDPRNEVYAFLAFPLVYVYTFVAGYYNFTIGVGLYLFVLAFWWRNRERVTLANVLKLTALMALCAITHPLAPVAAGGAIVLLSILMRRGYAYAVSLVPGIVVIAIHARAEGTSYPLDLSFRRVAAWILLKAQMIVSFFPPQDQIAMAFSAILIVLTIYTLVRRWRQSLPLMAVAIALAAVMFWFPAQAAQRNLFTERLMIFVYLTLAASFAPLEGAKRRVFLAVIVLLSIGNAAIILHRVRILGDGIREFVAMFEPVPAETSMLPLTYAWGSAPAFVNVYAHRYSYIALEKRLADPSNYEAIGHFPIAYRDPIGARSNILFMPAAVDIAHESKKYEYVVSFGDWKGKPNAADLEARYVVIASRGDTTLHRRSMLDEANAELVLLPLLGRSDVQGAPGGARWRVDQQLRNEGSRPLEVRFQRCVADVPCAMVIAPGGTRAIATPAGGSAMLVVPRADANALRVETIARRVDVDRPELSVHTPAARESAFTAGGTRIANIATAGKQIGLRVYILSPDESNDVTINVRANGTNALLATHTATLGRDGSFGTADLHQLFGEAPRLAPAIDLEVVTSSNVRCWAFATSGGADGRSVVYLPPS